ncbi:hypothetical protein [Spiroplasma endosymbiont of Dasysyrphus albostriatus]|uniref:hypothetical protein n=1 Tax=Spiroplasma endosymbiont of Dasysyrphus albostriatus TaxID=3066299 RepID=UPI0030CD546F
MAPFQILGIYGEIWTIAIDKNENVYIGTRESSFKGNVYKYQKNQNTFKKMDGINKSVSSLTFDNDDNIYAGVWTGSYQSPSNGEVYKCLAEETNFKPMSGIKGGVLSLVFNKNTNFYMLLHETEMEKLKLMTVHFINAYHQIMSLL